MVSECPLPPGQVSFRSFVQRVSWHAESLLLAEMGGDVSEQRGTQARWLA